jgi:anti-sigma-K factor RskA
MSGPDDMTHSEPDEGFERETAILRSLARDPVDRVDAPASVWDGIAAQLEAEGEPTQAPPAPPADRPIVLADRRRPVRWIAAAAAAVAVLIVAGVVVGTRTSDDPVEVAAAQLQPLDGIDVGEASAEVRLERDGDTARLEVEMDDLPAPAAGTFYEMWLLSDDGEPISVAAMRDPAPHVSTTITVPPGTDTDTYRVVDVSVQHEGAGPAHSGESILRGTLRA